MTFRGTNGAVRLFSIVATLALAILSGCATRIAQPSSSADRLLGTGSYHYRFTLVGPLGGIAANAPFALSLRGNRGLPFVHDRKGVWRGVTDDHGRTPVFALPFAIKPADVFLRGRLGDGPYGEQFQVTDFDGSTVAHHPYRLIICSDPPQYMVGLTDEDGNTFYSASLRPTSILLVAADYDLAAHGTAALAAKQKAEFEVGNIKRCAEGSANDMTGKDQ